jgi:hypothetical protein
MLDPIHNIFLTQSIIDSPLLEERYRLDASSSASTLQPTITIVVLVFFGFMNGSFIHGGQ